MRWRCSLCSVHTCVHALLSVEEFVQRRQKMTDRFSFHSFHKFKYRFFMSLFFLVVAFCRVFVLNEFASNENEREKDTCPNEKETVAIFVVRIVNENLWLSFITTFFYVYTSLMRNQIMFSTFDDAFFSFIHSFTRFLYLFSTVLL